MPRYGYADTPLGQLHYAEAGEGDPVLLLHQTPRSLDEFAEVQPLLASGCRAIAMDMYGFGMSAKPPGPHAIEQYAAGALALMDALGISGFDVFGHHTGAYAAVEVAAAALDRVRSLIISGGGYADAAFRASAPHDVDNATTADDGSHLGSLWSKRLPLYPTGRPDLLNRFVRDALAPGVDPQEGHIAVRRYVMETRVGLITAPVLIISGTDDPASYPQTRRLEAAFTNATVVEVVEIEGGMIPLLEQKPTEVADAVHRFIANTRASATHRPSSVLN